MKPEQKTVYTRIDQPIETRKEILNQVISIINILKGYDNIRRLQEEKIRYKNRLEKSIYQLQNVMKRLDDAVPPLNKELKPFVGKKEVIQRKQLATKKPEKQTHNQRLNQQLQEIQDKLKNIKI
ncbi:MAG: hypothetical protein NT139_03335 [Candidatus Woesearchaeota archaeon]|nr:hypothetical protein [Candidatus Woesearchaeota archaeon]